MIIRKSLEEMPERGLNILIYGDPGIGKTTLANTAPDPLVLDFDNGYHRASHSKHYVTYNSWGDVVKDKQDILTALKNDYKTLVVDTVGTGIDLMQNHIVETQPALKNNNIKMWGETKKTAADFFGPLKYAGKNVVYIAHAKLKEEGDTRRATPLIPGSTYDTILQTCDLVGYYTTTNNKHILTFDLSDTVTAKNCAGIAPIVVPDVMNMAGLLAGVIEETKAALIARAKNQEQGLEVVAKWTQAAEKTKDPNALYEQVSNAGLSNEVKRSVWFAIVTALNKRGFTWNADDKEFQKAKP
jgi:hypothetical protein